VNAEGHSAAVDAQRGAVALSRPGEFHPQPLTEPYVIVSHHTALQS